MDIGRTATTNLRIKIDPTGARQGAKQVNRSLDSIKSGAGSATRSVNLFSRALTLIGAGIAVSTVRRYADEWTMATNRLRVYAKSNEDLARVQAKLFEISQQTRTEFAATASLYNKLMIAQDGLSASQEDLIRFTRAVNQSLQISGASANTASGALLQLGQAMAAGQVQAEEFNSILEGMPRLAKAMAEGLDEAGGSIAKLKTLVKEGAVSSRDLFEAILSQTDKLGAQYQLVAPTISGAYQVMENAVIRLIGRIDSAGGVSAALARGIILLANNLETIGKTALVAASGVTAFFVSLKLSAIALAIRQLAAFQVALGASGAAAGLFSAAIGGVSAAIKALTVALAKNPFGLLLVGISTAISYLLLFGDTIKPIEGSIASLADFAAVAFAAIGSSISASVGIVVGAFTSAGNLILRSVKLIAGALNSVGNSLLASYRLIIGVFTGIGNSILTSVKLIPAAFAGVNKSILSSVDLITGSFTALGTFLVKSFTVAFGAAESAAGELFDRLSKMWAVASGPINRFIGAVKSSINTYIGMWIGAGQAIVVGFQKLPRALLYHIKKMLNDAIDVLNSSIGNIYSVINKILPERFEVDVKLIPKIEMPPDAHSGVKDAARDISTIFSDVVDVDYIGGAVDAIGRAANIVEDKVSAVAKSAKAAIADVLNTDDVKGSVDAISRAANAVGDKISTLATDAKAAIADALDTDYIKESIAVIGRVADVATGKIAIAAKSAMSAIQSVLDTGHIEESADVIGRVIEKAGAGITTMAEEARSAIAGFGAEWKRLAEARAALRQKSTARSPLALPAPALKPPAVQAKEAVVGKAVTGNAENQMNEDRELATRLIEEHLSSQEKINNAVKEYNRLRDMGLITEETYRAAISKLYQEHELVIGSMESTMAKISQASQRWADSMTEALVDAAMTGKLSFRDMANSIIRDLWRMTIRALIVRPLFEAIGGALKIEGFGGFKAEGGPVRSGKSYIVGEEGPELFTPGSSGFVSPAHTVSAIELAASAAADKIRTAAESARVTIKSALDTGTAGLGTRWKREADARADLKRKSVVEEPLALPAIEAANRLAEDHLSSQERLTHAVDRYKTLRETGLISDEAHRVALARLYQQHELIWTGIDGMMATASDKLADTADFGGFMARGGPVRPGKSYVVGENGPELFTPGSSGFVAAPSPAPAEPNISINIHNHATESRAEATVRNREDGAIDIDVIVRQLTDRLNLDTSRGMGLAPVMEGRYGLNPAAGMAV